MSRFRVLLPALCVFAVLASPLRADDLGEKAKAVLGASKGAVISVQVVAKQKMNFPGSRGEGQESKNEALGTVIDATGLTVVSLSATDPSTIMQTMMESMGGGGDGDDKFDFKVESEITDVKLLMGAGKEIPAQVVLRDKDLDLAFVRPLEKQAEPFKFLSLEGAGKPEILDQVIMLSRLGKVAGRTESVTVERIRAIIQKPRLFFVPGLVGGTGGLGAPVFTLDGKPIGITVLRLSKSGGGSGISAMLSGGGDMMMAVIIPAEDILAGAKQAPEADAKKAAKKDETKPAAAKEEKKETKKEK